MDMKEERRQRNTFLKKIDLIYSCWCCLSTVESLKPACLPTAPMKQILIPATNFIFKSLWLVVCALSNLVFIKLPLILCLSAVCGLTDLLKQALLLGCPFSQAVTQQALTIQMVFLELGFYPWRLEFSRNSFYSSPEFNEEVWKYTSQVARGTVDISTMTNLYPFVHAFLAERRNKHHNIKHAVLLYFIEQEKEVFCRKDTKSCSEFRALSRQIRSGFDERMQSGHW